MMDQFKKILYVRDLWWAFGSHLLNIKWAMIHAIKNNYHFFYRDNINQIFINSRIDTYFENLCSIDDEYIIKNNVCSNDCILYDESVGSSLDEERFNYVPEGFNNIQEFHQSLLRKIYCPNDFVKSNLNNNDGLIYYLRNNNIQYIGLHIRLSDKTSGPNKETDFIDLKYYLDDCLLIREKYDINVIVICSDTNYGIEFIKTENEKLERPFNICFNNENRAENVWTNSASHIINNTILDKDSLLNEYIVCFINFQLLLDAKILVGNFDSGFILAAVEYRNNGIDVNVNKKNPPIWGVEGIKKRWIENHNCNVSSNNP